MIDARNIAFGIEIETTASRRVLAQHNFTVPGAHRGQQIPYLPEGWKGERDGSISTTDPINRTGCEVVSPILKGEDGLRQVVEVANTLREKGHKVNKSCGVHVTVTWDGDAKALARLLSLVANHEEGIYASTGSKSRKTGGWAKPIKQYGNHKDANDKLTKDVRFPYPHQRYHLINLTHVAVGKNRIEFRCFSGSLDAVKLVAWVRLVLGLVEKAQNTKRASSWNAKANKGAWVRPTEGETEVGRLFYSLGWFGDDNASRARFGVVEGEGLPTTKECRDTLRRLARKYDGLSD